MVLINVKERLVDNSVPFFYTIKRNSSKTFATLYTCTVAKNKNETKTVKADIKLIQQLLNASQAGRVVQMEEILRHELSPVPLSLAKIGGQMNSTTKSDLLNILTSHQDINVPSVLPESEDCTISRTAIVIDGHALIQTLGKPPNCQTFSDYAEHFTSIVIRKFTGSVKRIDVVFDRYIGNASIKSGTRCKRVGKKKRPIRKIIDRGSVPLPQVWSQFISLDENKASLAVFLSHHLIKRGADIEDQYEIITAGGLEEPQLAASSRQGNTSQLQAQHEEADTRIILHVSDALANEYDRVLVQCRDTDVLLMLVHFIGPINADVWMMSGTAKQRKCYPIREIYQRLPKSVAENILGFHAVTGSDTTSSFTGHGKKTCWKIFIDYPDLLREVGRDGPNGPAEEFVCRIYGSSLPLAGVDKARLTTFQKGKKGIGMLPPTKDALYLHLMRANYQAKIWLQANIPQMDIGSPSDSGGWKIGANGIEIVWCQLPPVPTACIELVSCGCTTKCKRVSYKCTKSGQICTPDCGCNAVDCCNPAGL